MKTFHAKNIFLVITFVMTASLSYAEDFTVSVELPANGNLKFEPSLPADGKVEAGTTLTVVANADRGYGLDTLYAAVPGPWGFAYLESMQETSEIVVDQDMTISALFLPADEFEGFSLTDNVVYAQPGVKPLKYDVWSPDNATNLPMVVIIHGGGWTSNTEDIMRGMARQIVRTGKYVVVSIDYRWAGTGDGDAVGNNMADLIDDVFGAMAHIQEHAADYGGDASRIAVTGDSAGGHLSAVVASMSPMIGDGGFGASAGVFEFMPSYIPQGKSLAQVREEITQAVQAAAPSYGVFSDQSVDMPNLEHQSDDPQADQTWAAAIAPIHYVPEVSERAVPHYFVRGTQDFLIQNAMVQDFIDVLEANGQRSVYDHVEGAGHAFFDWKPDQQTRATFAQYGPEYLGKMVDFFDTVFYP